MKRRVLLLGAIAVGLCLAVLVAVTFVRDHRSRTPLLPSDPSEWERIDVSDLPEVAVIPVSAGDMGTTEPDATPCFRLPCWSNDGRWLAVLAYGENDVVVDLGGIDTGARRRLSHVDSMWFDWHPSGERFLVGQLDESDYADSGDID